MLALEKFGDKWHAKFPQISRAWGTYWSNLNTLFNNPEDIRKAIYTTNAIESLNIRERGENWNTASLTKRSLKKAGTRELY
ncbi:TPA: transposase [Vibrio parahaemolyticus]|nr:transposase [Vibrio parahaemolyticus]